MHVLGLEFKCKQFGSQLRGQFELSWGQGKQKDERRSKYSLDVRLEDSLFLLGETEFHSVNKHRKKRPFPAASTVFNTFTSVSKEGCLELKLPVTLSKFTVLPRAESHISSARPFPHGWKDEYLILFSIPELSDRGGWTLHRGQSSTPLTRAVSRVMVNSFSVCKMREKEWTAAQSRSRAPSSYIRAVRGSSAKRGSQWERSRSLWKTIGQSSVTLLEAIHYISCWEVVSSVKN